MVGNPEVGISQTSLDSKASSGNAILVCVFYGESTDDPDIDCPKTQYYK